MINIDFTKLKWVKNIKRDNGKEWAYFDEFENDEFILHWSDTIKASASKPQEGDLMALFQNYKNQGIRITHIIEFLSNDVIIDLENHEKYQYGRKVKILYITKNLIHHTHFNFNFKSVAYGHACNLKYLSVSEDLLQVQSDIKRIINNDYNNQFRIEQVDGKLSITFPPNKIHNVPQKITTNSKVITLIGENGCGKSAILESVFKSTELNNEFRTIAFSSGQNELFTNLFEKIQRNNRSNLFSGNKENQVDYQESTFTQPINSFYYNHKWAKLLIFFAITYKTDGLVNSFLKTNNYVEHSGDDIDISSFLEINVKVLNNYINKVKREKEVEERGTSSSFLQSKYHKKLSHFIDKAFPRTDESLYDFEQKIDKQNYRMSVDSALRIFEEKNPDLTFNFFWYGSSSSMPNFDIDNVKLYLKGFELNDLSDGEYQLLCIYALIDLFDDEKTIFLLDEIDSHLYFKNISLLWKTLNQLRSTVITTTHIADSIILNKISNIFLVQQGKLNNDFSLNGTIERMKNLSASRDFEYKISATAENLVLIDNINDWLAFKKFASIKCQNYDETLFDKIRVINVSCGADNNNEQFGNNKLLWLEYFLKVNKARDRLCKNIFMLCDKDSHPIPFNQNGVQVTGNNSKRPIGNNKFAYLLAWKRREIENYFISYSLLNRFHLIEAVNDVLLRGENLVVGSKMDLGSIRDAQVKDIIKDLYSDHDGINNEQRLEIIDLIPPEEISEDIENMYNFIVSKIN
jgi:ABC-type cobalamin/Fe3+-siderophores transport system ATPase subunit